MQKVLIKFRHGVGDCVQLTIVLQHIKYFKPDWLVDIFCPTTGKESIFTNLCNQVLTIKPDHNQYNHYFDLTWPDFQNEPFLSCPATKPITALNRKFNITPKEQLCYYNLIIKTENRLKVQKFINTLSCKKFVVLHYQGNTSRKSKNLSHEVASKIIHHCKTIGYPVILLDWDKRSTLIGKENVYCPEGGHFLWDSKPYGNPATIAALIERAKLFIGVDSGPLHIAGTTKTPALGIWRKHHPIHFYDLSYNVTHLLPNTDEYLRGEQKLELKQYFEKKYKYAYYNNEEQMLELIKKQIT